MANSADDSRLARLEAQMEQILTTLQEMRAEIHANNARMDQINYQSDGRVDQIDAGIDQVITKIDRLTLAVLGIGGVIIALIFLAAVLAARLGQS